MVIALGNLIVVGILAASLVVWARIAARLRRREPVVPYESRQPVPWTGWDVALIVLWWLSADLLAGAVAAHLGAADSPPPAAPPGQSSPAPHLVLVLLQSAPNGAVLLLCLLAAVVLAPAVEEFLFRLLLQGWLERTEGAAHETGNPVAARFPLSLWLPAAIFASFHLRLEREPPAPETIVRFLIASAVARGALVVLGLAWLRWRPDQSATVGARPATWRDLGIVPQRFAADLRLGLAALAAVFVPVVGLQAALNAWLPARLEALGLPAFAPDPAPLFILALALGYLYRQTHRIVPSIVLHAGLNATMVLAAWLGA